MNAWDHRVTRGELARLDPRCDEDPACQGDEERDERAELEAAYVDMRGERDALLRRCIELEKELAAYRRAG